MLCHFTNDFNVCEWGVITMILFEPKMWSLGLLRHGLRTPNEGINQRYLKNWADVADKICFDRT